MPSNRRLFRNGQTYFVTFRTEDGLPFLPIQFINTIVESNLAKAQALYPQHVSAFTLEPNHCHAILTCEDPETLPAFIGYFKQETAHAINRLLGRRRKTVWLDDYDAPAILDLKAFLKYYAYCVLNPVKDRLAASIDTYQGVSSYSMFKQQTSVKIVPLISRNSIPCLLNPHKPSRENKSVMQKLNEASKGTISLRINHYAWKKCFPETSRLSDAELHELLTNTLEIKEKEITEKLSEIPHYHSESSESLLKTYVPKKFGKKMLCLSSFSEMRESFMLAYRCLASKAREAFTEWCYGNLKFPFPAGMFAPCLPRSANLIP